jgi:transcriptional antiterminator NusG
MAAELKWYVLRAVSGQETKVKSYLDTEIMRRNLKDYIDQVLIPRDKILKMTPKGVKKTIEKPRFPGYILISADLSHGEALHTITSMPGVLGFLGNAQVGMTSKIPVSLRQSEVNHILGVIDDSQYSEAKLETPYIKGETIKVKDGPFNGFTGTVEEVYEERKRLNVTVKIFGRITPVELDYVQVEKQA